MLIYDFTENAYIYMYVYNLSEKAFEFYFLDTHFLRK